MNFDKRYLTTVIYNDDRKVNISVELFPNKAELEFFTHCTKGCTAKLTSKLNLTFQ